LLKAAVGKFHTEPEHPWSQYPSYAVLRHQNRGKWYALFMSVPSGRLGLSGDGIIEVVNVKCKPEMVGSLRKIRGFLPAYHMNKEHWVTVLLDGSVRKQELVALIAESYALTSTGKPRLA
jgi:predicted DNA-binding protein (MmcQ/YjbR family)